MNIDDIYSKEIIDSFLSKVSPDDLKNIKEIYFICNPSKPERARKIRINAPQPLHNWDSNWKALEEPEDGNDPRKIVVDENERAKKVYDYYIEHKKEFKDVKTVNGQKRLAEATDESGGSLLFHHPKNKRQTAHKLATGFIALAKAINEGTFEVDAWVRVSMTLLPVIHTSRIKISKDRSLDGEFLKKIRDILHVNQCSDLNLKIKTNVASFLNWELRREGAHLRFESPSEGWSRRIDQLGERLTDTNPVDSGSSIDQFRSEFAIQWFIKLNEETANRIHNDFFSVSRKLAAPLEELSHEIENYYYENVQSRDEFKAKVKLRDMIAKIVQSSSNGRVGWPKSIVVITGSSITGIATKKSDVDLCVAIPDALDHFQSENDAARECVKIMEHRLVEDEEFYDLIIKEKSGDRKMQFVDASIPLLKMEVLIDGLNIECDLSASCNRKGFVSSLHNSFLLLHYVKFDKRVGPLCFFIKQWAKNHKIYNPINGGLNSYCLTLLVIHYLQCGLNPPILPNFIQLYPSFFAISEQVFPHNIDFDAELPWQPDDQIFNPLNMGQLFYGFISYYSEFDFEKLGIDMKNGRVWKRPRQSYYKRPRILHICDPIDTHNPGRTLRQDGLEHMKGILGRMRKVFQNAAKTTSGVRSTNRLPSFQILLGDPDAYGE